MLCIYFAFLGNLAPRLCNRIIRQEKQKSEQYVGILYVLAYSVDDRVGSALLG